MGREGGRRREQQMGSEGEQWIGEQKGRESAYDGRGIEAAYKKIGGIHVVPALLY